MSTDTRITEAATRIDATETPDGRYVFCDDATQGWYVATADEMLALWERIQVDRVNAYSLWCAGTTGGSQEIDYDGHDVDEAIAALASL